MSSSGSGSRGNGLRGQEFRLFDVYDVNAGRYLANDERLKLAKALDIPHVPVIHEAFVITPKITMELLLAMADGTSALKPNQLREGLVFKALTKQASFKTISNKYLLKQK